MRFRELLKAAMEDNNFLYYGVPCQVMRVTGDQGVCVGFEAKYKVGRPPITEKEVKDLKRFDLCYIAWVEADDLYREPPEPLTEQVKVCTCGASATSNPNLHSSWCDVL